MIRLYKELFLTALACLAFIVMPDRAMAADGLALSNQYVQAGTSKEVGIALNNQTSYTAFQLDITLSEGLTFAKENGSYAISLSSRSNGHVLSVEEVSPGCLRVVVYSMNNKAFTGSNGVLLTFKMNVANDFADNGTITIDNIRFTTSTINEVKFKSISAAVKLGDPTIVMGDVNGDGVVDTQDAIKVVQYFLKKNPENFNLEAADVTTDGNVDTQDAIQIIRIYLKKE